MSSPSEDTRPMCKYGTDCYQKNPEHHKKYQHPKRKSEEKHEDSKRTKVETVQSSSSETTPCRDEEKCTGCGRSDDYPKEFVKVPTEREKRVETVFLIQMPPDFYSFYDFCKSINSKNPHSALSLVDLLLVGPYDLFDKELKQFTEEEGLCHYRYYFDPPEFMTILTCNKKELHYGYFRDSPKEMPSFVASNEADSGCTLEIVGENIFSAVNFHIEETKKTVDPFKKMKIQQLQLALQKWSNNNKFSFDTKTKAQRERRNKIVAKTFHGAGIVVPFNKKTELGYRELQESDKHLKQILKDLCESKTEEERKIFWTKLHPIITAANIANDEFDFGTSLELGIDLFCFGDPLLHKAILNILPTSYELLERFEFSTILKAHLKHRIKGSSLNTILKWT